MCPCFLNYLRCMHLQFFASYHSQSDHARFDLLSLQTTLDAGAKDLGFPSVLCRHVSQPACNGGGSGLEYE